MSAILMSSGRAQVRAQEFFAAAARKGEAEGSSGGHTSNWAVIVCASRYWCAEHSFVFSEQRTPIVRDTGGTALITR